MKNDRTEKVMLQKSQITNFVYIYFFHINKNYF